MLECMSTPWFMTHHAPWGSSCSLTFGKAGSGVSIDRRRPQVEHDADLLVAWGRGPGTVRALPFITGNVAMDQETVQMHAAGGRRPDSFREAWQVLPASAVERTLEPDCDTFDAGELRLRVVHPCDRIADPTAPTTRAADVADALLPAVWLELTIDNRAHDVPAHAVLGLAHARTGRMRPLPWQDPGLAGIAFDDDWALAARAEPGRVETVRDGAIARLVEDGTGHVRMCGREGGILLHVPPRSVGTLRACFAFHQGGIAVCQEQAGGRSHLAAEQSWPTLTSVVQRALAIAEPTIARAAQRHGEWIARLPDATQRELLAQAVQAYRANSQVLKRSDGAWGFVVTEGCFLWRNTLDLAADHLAWERDRHPWTVRMVIDDLTQRHSYHDRIRLPHELAGTYPHAGGLSFAHDQGSSGTESPAGRSGYERAEVAGCYAFMTTEQLLNGIYCLAAAAHDDAAWRTQRLPWFSAALESLERRDHPEANQRDGILKATSSMVGVNGAEITTYDALDHSLMAAAGNIYIVVKAWVAALLLEETFRAAGDAASADRARIQGERTARALIAAFDRTRGCFPANLLDATVPALVPAAIEPLAMAADLGLGSRLRADTTLFALLQQHARTTLAVCIDPQHGGLRLSSTSTNTWPSKAALVLSVAQNQLDLDLARNFSGAWRGVADWMQRLAADVSCADQIDIAKQVVVGATYYPRMVTLACLLQPAASSELRQAAAIS
jgi:hypothetical protein